MKSRKVWSLGDPPLHTDTFFHTTNIFVCVTPTDVNFYDKKYSNQLRYWGIIIWNDVLLFVSPEHKDFHCV